MRKVYRYTGITLFLTLCFGLALFASALGVIASIISNIYERDIESIVASSIVFITLFSVVLYAFMIKLPIPIYVTDEKVSQGKVEYKWEDVRMTAVPFIARYRRIFYMLLLRTDYIRDLKTCKKETRKGLCVLMTPQLLNILLPHYNNKILVLDEYGYEEVPCASRKEVNQMIVSHNAKFDSSTKVTDCGSDNASIV
ncbi:MAG: hypothetical protein K2M95_00550 [Clostridiales bacterium]|nr:hypothetical protein [Clostridiales bacterium]